MLLGYALGRGIHPGDFVLLDRLQSQLEEGNDRLSVLVEEIVTSPQSRLRRLPGEGSP
jgi:hypothetical protein